jgi:prepilin-type N-terminal cleavage/methylation domain-containing protein
MPKTQKAFTLIEVLIVCVIILIMTSVVLVSLGNARLERETEAGAREFTGVVREIQGYALTGRQINCSGSSCPSPCEYRLSWSGSTYTFTYRAKNGAGNCVSASTINYTLRDGVTFQSAGSLSFLLPHASLSIPGGGSLAQVTIRKSGVTKNVCVSSSGLVSDC